MNTRKNARILLFFIIYILIGRLLNAGIETGNSLLDKEKELFTRVVATLGHNILGLEVEDVPREKTCDTTKTTNIDIKMKKVGLVLFWPAAIIFWPLGALVMLVLFLGTWLTTYVLWPILVMIGKILALIFGI